MGDDRPKPPEGYETCLDWCLEQGQEHMRRYAVQGVLPLAVRNTFDAARAELEELRAKAELFDLAVVEDELRGKRW